jgi:hypothetical protein
MLQPIQHFAPIMLNDVFKLSKTLVGSIHPGFIRYFAIFASELSFQFSPIFVCLILLLIWEACPWNRPAARCCVIPAQAGIPCGASEVDSRLRGNDTRPIYVH